MTSMGRTAWHVGGAGSVTYVGRERQGERRTEKDDLVGRSVVESLSERR